MVEKAPKKASMKKEKSQVGDVKATKKQATAVETKSAKKAGKTSDKRKRAVVDSEVYSSWPGFEESLSRLHTGHV